MATDKLKTRILLPHDTKENWTAGTSRNLSAGELAIATLGNSKFEIRTPSINGQKFGDSLTLEVPGANVTLTSCAPDVQTAIGELSGVTVGALSGVTQTDETVGVVTAVAKDGRNVKVTSTSLAGTKSATGDVGVGQHAVLTSITQGANGQITEVGSAVVLTAHQSLADYYNKTEVNAISAALSGAAKAYADGKVEALDYTDTPAPSKFVTKVDETDGVIAVTRAQPALSDLSDKDTVALKGAATDTSAAVTLYGVSAYAKDYADAKAADTYTKAEIQAISAATVTSANGYTDGKIADLDVSDTAVAGQFVTQVTETNGKIAVTRGTVSLSDLTDKAEVYGISSSISSALIGQSTDPADANTIYGAKQYAETYADNKLTGYYKKSETSSAGELSVEFAKYTPAADLTAYLSAVSGTGTGVVTGISRDGQTVSATFTSLTGTAELDGYRNAITAITQDARGKITSVAGVHVLSSFSISATDGGSGDAYVKKYTFTVDGSKQATEIEIPKDKVLESGKLVDVKKTGGTTSADYEFKEDNVQVTDTDQLTALRKVYTKDGPYIKLVLENVATPVYIGVPTLVDSYDFANSDTVGFTTSGYTVSADVAANSLKMKHLSDTEVFVFDCGNASGN